MGEGRGLSPRRRPAAPLPARRSLPPAPGRNRGAESGVGRRAGRWARVRRPGQRGRRRTGGRRVAPAGAMQPTSASLLRRPIHQASAPPGSHRRPAAHIGGGRRAKSCRRWSVRPPVCRIEPRPRISSSVFSTRAWSCAPGNERGAGGSHDCGPRAGRVAGLPSAVTIAAIRRDLTGSARAARPPRRATHRGWRGTHAA